MGDSVIATKADRRRREKAGRELPGRPTLGTVHAVAQALQIGPTVSASLVAYLLAAAAGPLAPLVVLIVFLGSLSLGWAVSLYARRYAGAGASYEFIARAISKRLGIFSSALLVFEIPFAMASIYVATGLLWQSFLVAHVGFDPLGPVEPQALPHRPGDRWCARRAPCPRSWSRPESTSWWRRVGGGGTGPWWRRWCWAGCAGSRSWACAWEL